MEENESSNDKTREKYESTQDVVGTKETIRTLTSFPHHSVEKENNFSGN